MAGRGGGAKLADLEALFRVGAVGSLSDGQLLDRFAGAGRGGDSEAAEHAFAAMVGRHGPMVLRVCRAFLRDEHAAHDAFQATFLVLALRAGSIRSRESAASWLHGVARRVAAGARAAEARRARLERRAAGRVRERVETDPPADADGLAAAVHEELARLPRGQREAVVVCDLEGLTEGQAARRLGWPVGTVRSRRARGRARLRVRLSARGLAPGALALASALLPAPARAHAQAAALARLAAGLASGGPAAAAVSAPVRHLMRKGTGMILPTGWKTTIFALGTLGTLATGAASLPPSRRPPADDPPRAEAPEPAARTLVERATLEATEHLVVNRLESPTTIITILPEGRFVKQGDLVCELDSGPLRDDMIGRAHAETQAEVAARRARLDREAAELALREYAEGNADRERDALAAEVESAREDQEAAGRRVERAREALRRLETLAEGREAEDPAAIIAGLDVADRLEDAELELGRRRRAPARAESALRVHEDLTRPRRIKELERDVALRLEDEIARVEAGRLAKLEHARLKRQIVGSRLYAPSDGQVIYAGDAKSPIGEGATVREGQVIFRLVEQASPFRANVKVPEAWVDQVPPGGKARVEVDAFPGRTWEGVIEAVAPRPDPSTRAQAGVKVYTTLVRLEGDTSGLRRGMTARVEMSLTGRPAKPSSGPRDPD